ncbi:MAG: class I SAM-dependent methyltransferase [Spirochaetales bacterium]|nr:class I SAM-dependent methyltransferase [Spirochaetales bacterium]
MNKTYSKFPSAHEQMRRVSCPLCHGNQFRPCWRAQGAFFETCQNCGLVVQNPRPIPSDLAHRYDDEYFQYEKTNEEAFFHLMELGLNDLNFHERLSTTLPQPPIVLDVGCATGRLLKDFAQRGWKTAGAELCQASAAYGNTHYHVNIVPSTLEDAAFESHHFSLVHASHVIEHVDDPLGFAQELFRVLRPGGMFLCTTPAVDGFQARLFRGRWRSAIADHVTLFSKATLQQLLNKAGFEVEEVRTWGGLAAGSAPRWIKNPVDRWAKRSGLGDVVLMAARKPSNSP